MKLTNYRQVENYVVASAIAKELELDWDAKIKIEEYLQYSPYVIFIYDKAKKTNLLFRLTAPFYLIFTMLTLIFTPIKWVFTGSFYYNREGNIVKLYMSWTKKLGF